MTIHLRDEFWSRLGKVQAGMLKADGIRAVAMSPYADKEMGAIWFISAKGTDLAKAAMKGADAQFHVADPSAHLFSSIEGHVSVVEDRAKLDEIWNVVAAAWFEDGRDDKDICLIKMVPREGEVWATDGPASFLYEIAKSQITHEHPDVGDHGRVTF